MVHGQNELPFISAKGIQGSIVHTQHHIGIHGLPLGISHTHGPLLRGTWLGKVAESFPMQMKSGIRKPFVQWNVLGTHHAIQHVCCHQANAVGITVLIWNIHACQCIRQQHHSIYCHTLAGKGCQEDIALLSCRHSEFQPGRRLGIKGIHRTLQPFLGPLPSLHHWGIGKQTYKGIVGLSFALGRKHRHVHLHPGSVAIGIGPVHGYCQHKSSLHICIDGIQVAALVSRHPSPPPAGHSPCCGSYPAASQGCAVIVHGTSRHVYYAILNLFFLTFHGQDTHFHVPLVHLHIEHRALVLLHPYLVNRTIHTHPVVAQFRIHGNLHCCAQSTEIVRAKRRVSQHLASSLLLQLDPAFGTLPDLCLPVLHAIQDGRHLHLLAWTVYASVCINSHTRLLLGRRCTIMITVIICYFRQATVRTQDNTHGIPYRVLLLAFYHRRFGNRFACACIHCSDTYLFAGHIRNKAL